MIARALVFAAACFCLAACNSISVVEGGKPVSVGDGVTVDSQIRWTRINFGSGVFWTLDGAGLNELRFLLEVKPGKPLTSVPGVSTRDLPLYQKEMLPDEVMEMTVGTLGKMGYEQVKGSALRPVPFGAAKGFRFDLDFVSQGLQMKGAVIARQHGDHLDLILFVGPGEFYFGRDLPVVEKVFASIQAPA